MSGPWAPEGAEVAVEVAVVGGGPAGAATALALARLGRRVAVLSRPAHGPGWGGETLPPEVRGPLAALGLWGRFLDGGPVAWPGHLSAWGGPDLQGSDFIANPFGCGWHVDRRDFDAMLAGAFEDAGGLLLSPMRLLDVARVPRAGWALEGEAGGRPIRLRAGTLVDATGRPASLARRLGARRVAHDRLVGLMTSWSSPRSAADEGHWTLVEAVEDGWWYTGRRAGGGLSASFLTDADLIPRGRGALSRFLEGRLRSAPRTRRRLGDPAGLVGVRARPAAGSRLDHAAGEGWLAVGDAAATLDPLSSQGVYRALVSGLEAAQAINQASRGDRLAIGAYGCRAESDARVDLGQRAAYYQAERRWPTLPFWRRRQGPAAAGDHS